MIDRIERMPRNPVQRAADHAEDEQHPQKPQRSARPRADRDHVLVELGEALGRVGAQRQRVVGDRDHGERRDHERDAEPDQPVARQRTEFRPVVEARPQEQPRQHEEHRHEEAVGGEHDAIEADERARVGVAEIGVGDHRMVDQHQDSEEGAGSVKRQVAHMRSCVRGHAAGGGIGYSHDDSPVRCRR